MRTIIRACFLIIVFASAGYPLGLSGCFNSDFSIFQDTATYYTAFDSVGSRTFSQFHDLTLSLADDAGRHTANVMAYVYNDKLTANRFILQVPVFNYQYRSPSKDIHLNAGRFIQVTGFDFFNMDGASLSYNFLESWRVEGAAGALVDSGLKFKGRDNVTGYAAVTKTFGLRNSVKMTFARASKDKQLIANDLGLHLKWNTEKKWHLSLGGKITQSGNDLAKVSGYRLTESYSRLTYTPKRLKYQFYVGTRSFFPTLYDPTDFYYFEYLFYNKAFAGSRLQLPLNSVLNAQADLLQAGGKSFGNISAYWVHQYLTIRLEKGFVDKQNDYLADGQLRYSPLAGLNLSTGGSLVHYQTRANSFPGASDLSNIFTSVYIASELNLPRPLLLSARLENRTNRQRVYDLRLFMHLSYTFTTEKRERFPWEY